MKHQEKYIIKTGLLFSAIFLIVSLNTLFAQISLQSYIVDIKLSGTSTLHDWIMTSAKGKADAEFTIDASGKLVSIDKLSFILPATSLKSERKQMDNNTYKALQTKAHPQITFMLTSCKVTPNGANEYTLNSAGNLTIAGTTKLSDLVTTVTYNPADKSYTVEGVKKMKMTDFNVKPPTVMLGTIKTGNDITISYKIKFK